MPTPIFDFEWKTGDTCYLELFYNDVNNVPMELDGFEFDMDIKEKRTDTSAILSATATIENLETARVLFTFEPYETMDLAGTKIKATYYYDVECTSPGGEVLTILSGRISVYRSITNQN